MSPKFFHRKTVNNGSIRYKVADDITTADQILSSLNRPLSIVSIDPGYKNFCLRIEERPRYTDHVFPIRQVFCDVINIGEEVERYFNLTTWLNDNRSLFNNIDIILIEKQMNDNTSVMRIAQHAMSWFYSYYFDRDIKAQIIEFCPKTKLRSLGCPSNLNKRGYKEWITKWAEEEFRVRGDGESLNALLKTKKTDDISDTLAQIESFCILENYPTSSKIYSYEHNQNAHL